MKKNLALLLALTLIFVLVACSNEKDTNLDLNTSTTQTKTESTDTSDSQTSETDKDESSSDIEIPSNSTNTPTTSNPATTSKPASTHTHNFSNATCTQASKCSCGVTSGKALGHKWKAATCTIPKSCSVCKITQGKALGHKNVGGICVVCNTKDTTFDDYNEWAWVNRDSDTQIFYVTLFFRKNLKGSIFWENCWLETSGRTQQQLEDAGFDVKKYNGKLYSVDQCDGWSYTYKFNVDINEIYHDGSALSEGELAFKVKIMDSNTMEVIEIHNGAFIYGIEKGTVFKKTK